MDFLSFVRATTRAPLHLPMPRRPLLLETFEDRILCSAAPNVTLSAPATAKIGDTVSVAATFDNTAGTNPGFAPYIDVVVDKTGADGDDGLTFQGATYLGANVTSTVLTFDAFGNATHPYAKDASGNALVISAPSGYGAGDQLIVLQLPFGSFTPQQPGAAVNLSFAMSNLADVGTPLQLSERRVPIRQRRARQPRDRSLDRRCQLRERERDAVPFHADQNLSRPRGRNRDRPELSPPVPDRRGHRRGPDDFQSRPLGFAAG
jgi:hypothetical protein